MLDSIAGVIVFAAEEIPADTAMAKLIVPFGLLAFLGTTYMLLRSNLGTRLGYYVLGTSFFGFLFIFSLFWAFGAPGTPQATGPTNLPGQPPDALLPKWVPFAQDSLLADREDLQIVKQFPEGFEEEGWPAEMAAGDGDETNLIDQGISDIQQFFASEEAGQQVGETWAVQSARYAAAPGTGYPVLAVTYVETDEALQPVEGGATYTAFGYFDAGSPLLPSYIVIGLSLVGLFLHAGLLDRYERRERRRLAEAREQARAERERVPAGA